MDGGLCERFGPGRLPYASRRDVGGGIATGGMALLAALLWAGGAVAVLFTTDVGTTLGFAAVAGALVAAPLAAPVTFVIGTLAWRHAAPVRPDPRRGAALGATTALLSLLACAVACTAALFADYATSTATGEPIEVVALPALFLFGLAMVVPFAILLAGWLVVPLGALAGYVHERARRRQWPTPEQRAAR